jgi:hypothetical protein
MSLVGHQNVQELLVKLAQTGNWSTSKPSIAADFPPRVFGHHYRQLKTTTLSCMRFGKHTTALSSAHEARPAASKHGQSLQSRNRSQQICQNQSHPTYFITYSVRQLPATDCTKKPSWIASLGMHQMRDIR